MTVSALFLLPWPPSVNTYWRSVVIGGRSRVLLSRAGRDYRAAVAAVDTVAGWADPIESRLSVVIVANPPDRRRRDLDNLPKGILDSLQHAGVYRDDCLIDTLVISRGPIVQAGRVAVLVEEQGGQCGF